MRVLIACAASGVMAKAFAARGHDAWECDLRPSENGGQHIQGDALEIAGRGGWDLMIAQKGDTRMNLTTTNTKHDLRCPNCGKFVESDADGYYDRMPPYTEDAYVECFCDEACSQAFRVKNGAPNA